MPLTVFPDAISKDTVRSLPPPELETSIPSPDPVTESSISNVTLPPPLLVTFTPSPAVDPEPVAVPFTVTVTLDDADVALT